MVKKIRKKDVNADVKFIDILFKYLKKYKTSILKLKITIKIHIIKIKFHNIKIWNMMI